MRITSVLAAYKTALQGIVPPSGQSSPAVYVHPTDTAAIDYNVDGVFEALPVIVVAELISAEQSMTRKTQGAQAYAWQIETQIFLAQGFFKDHVAAAEVEALMTGWVTAYNTVLQNDPNLGTEKVVFGNVGGDGLLFTIPRKGHMAWNGKEYWGIPILTPVTQLVS